ncbi:Uncharacterized protein Rs2_35527 [Raphanus sativus]|nr:Uncharacterized protein Rs2_35527 [Raphanus sativus]
MDVSTEKTSEDSREIKAEIMEPSDVTVETAPTTVNKGPAGPALLATPAIETHSGEEKNEKTPSSGDEENHKSVFGEEENEHDDGSNQENENGENEDGENEDSEEEQESDGENEENEVSEEGNGDGEGKDDENECSEEKNRDGEELANGDRETNENENPPEPEGLNGNVGLKIIKPTNMFFKPFEYSKKIKLGTRCMIASAIKMLKNLKTKLSNAEWSWFTEHPQFKHIFHMKSENNHRVQGMWMLLLRTAGSERRREVWFIVNGVTIRYGLREHVWIQQTTEQTGLILIVDTKPGAIWEHEWFFFFQRHRLNSFVKHVSHDQRDAKLSFNGGKAEQGVLRKEV